MSAPRRSCRPRGQRPRWAFVVLAWGVVGCRIEGSSTAQGIDGGGPAAPAAARSPAVTDLDLVANRVHAVVHRDGRLVVGTDDPAFLKFVDGGWKSSWILGERDGGKRVAHVSGLSAALTVPVDLDGDGAGSRGLVDLRLRLVLRALPPKQRLTVFVNDKQVGTTDVPRTSTAVDFTVPAGFLVVGENRIRLTFRSSAPLAGRRRSAAALERFELGLASAPPVDATGTHAAPGPLAPASVDVGGEARRALSLGGPGRISYYVQVPAGGKLAVSYAAASPGATALVRVASDEGTPATLFEGPAPARWTDGTWDLAAWKEQAVRIDLVARGGAVAWAAPRLTVPAPPAAETSAARSDQKLDRIFIWMVDTLRADKVHVFNPKTVVQTPNYDAFAEDATRFAWAAVPGTWSLPSHASILTGVYPTVHQATAHSARLSPKVPFIAELMKKAGYRTAMFSSNGYVSGKWGFDRGWDRNRNFIRESLPNGADFLWKNAKPWILANGQKKQFVYLATVEPHVIYNPKKQYLKMYWTKPYDGPIKPALTGIQLGYIKTGKLKPTATDKAYLEALHNAEITQSDALFGAFIADLKAAGLYDSSAIVVISDHGDEFWDHGDVGHAQSVHQELVHIPLVIRAPGVMPAGKVVTADVEAMDLFPTVLELAGIPIPESTQASSLVPLAAGEPGPRAAWSQNLTMSRGIKVGRYRLIHAGARLELYDELADPREQSDLDGRRPIALRQIRNVFSLLAAHEDRWRKREWGTAANVTESFYSAVPW